MPITLTTPKDVGDLDSNNYTTVKILEIFISVSTASGKFSYQLGYISDGEFVPGKLGKEHVSVLESEFLAIVNVPATVGETLWDHHARALYQYLIDKDYFVGTIA